MILSLLTSLALAGTLDGVVQDAEGEVVPGATVYAWNQRLASTSTTADGAGRFTLTGLPAGTWRLRAVPGSTTNRVPRFMPDALDFCSSEAVTLAEDEVAEGLRFALPEGSVLAGALLDSEGAPVDGAVVYVLGAEDAVDGLGRAAVSDEDGLFEVLGLEAFDGGSAYVVEAQAAGFPDQYLGATYEESDAAVWTVPVQDRQDVGSHTLLDGILVTGRVEGPDGPVDGAEVIVYGGGQVTTVLADEGGDYEAVGLAPGDVLPWAGGPGLATTYWPDADRPTSFLEAPDEGEVLEGADLFLPYEAVFQASFVDAESGEAVGPVQALLYNDTYTVGRGTQSDEEGLLQIDELHGGAYFLYYWAESRGYTDGWLLDQDGERLPLEVVAEQANEPVVIELGAAGQLSGNVTDEHGAPLQGAVLVAQRSDGSVGSAESAADGSWSMAGLGPGDWQLYATLESYCPGDPTYVPVYHPQTVNVDWLSAVSLEEGDSVGDLDLSLPVDADQDGMGDTWEEDMGLDSSVDDAAQDPDDDGYINLVEYRLGTDPLQVSDAGGGCGSRGAAFLLLLLPAWLRRRS